MPEANFLTEMVMTLGGYGKMGTTSQNVGGFSIDFDNIFPRAIAGVSSLKMLIFSLKYRFMP